MSILERILNDYTKWCEKNHITPYPDRSKYFERREGFIFFNESCCVYIKKNNKFCKLEPDLYQNLIHTYWNEDYNDDKARKKNSSYDKPISAHSKDEFKIFLKDKNTISPEGALLKKEEKNIVKKAVGRLKPKRREVIEAIFYEGMTEAEAAVALNKTQATIHALKTHALADIKQTLTEEYELL